MSTPIRLGTRRSALAQAQSGHVAAALEKIIGRSVELVPITSEGDTNRASLSLIGGQGIFATRLREALLAGECDFLVHSLKDLPTAQPDGLVIAATPVREDARDVAITRDGIPLHQLTPGSRIGTGSPRRIAQVHIRAPHADVVDIRGNVDSRLQKVATGELDAVILAAAGLSRLGSDSPNGPPLLARARWPSRRRRMPTPSCSPPWLHWMISRPGWRSRSNARSSKASTPDARRRWPLMPSSRDRRCASGPWSTPRMERNESVSTSRKT